MLESSGVLKVNDVAHEHLDNLKNKFLQAYDLPLDILDAMLKSTFSCTMGENIVFEIKHQCADDTAYLQAAENV